MQPGPAYEPHLAAVQVEISGQSGLNVALIGVAIHRLAKLHDAAEFVATAVLRVGQYELRVVLSGHGFRLPPSHEIVCELSHKSQELLRRNKLAESTCFASAHQRGLKFNKFGRGAQIWRAGICNIDR